jgi:hypothetical protein
MNLCSKLISLTSNECHQKHTIMLVLQAVADALDTQIDKQQVSDRVDDFGAVYRRIVVLFE